jgi:hypothetical protein
LLLLPLSLPVFPELVLVLSLVFPELALPLLALLVFPELVLVLLLVFPELVLVLLLVFPELALPLLELPVFPELVLVLLLVLFIGLLFCDVVFGLLPTLDEGLELLLTEVLPEVLPDVLDTTEFVDPLLLLFCVLLDIIIFYLIICMCSII